jgi:XRE family transcriptional regulator, regulator of sulfur utilization
MSAGYLKRLGLRLRELRKNAHMTLEDLADKADLNPNYIARIERGEVNVTVQTLERIAKGLSLELQEILVHDKQPFDEKKLKKELGRILSKLEPEKLHALKALLALH